MVMQVKKATFQRMGSGGKGRTENRWDVSDGQSSPLKYILYFHDKYIQKSAADRQSDDGSVPGDCRVLFYKRDQYLALLYT